MSDQATVQTVNVTLSKNEEKSLGMISPALREQARADMLATKRAAKVAWLNTPENQARMARDKVNRESFSFKVSPETGVGSLYGIGRRFPVALHKGEWVRLLSYLEQIKAAVAAMPDQK